MDRRVAGVIVVIAFFLLALRACHRPLVRPAYQSDRNSTHASPTRPVYPTSAPPPAQAPASPASIFERQLAAAEPGSWIKSGDVPPVLPPGPPGSWDDFKAGSPAALAERGGYRLWYRGCHFRSDGYGCGVGYAASTDGVTWERSPEPVFEPADPYEREHLDFIAVARGKKGYVLWYSVSASPEPERRRAKLHVARSPDGIAWAAQPGAVYEAVAQPAHLRPAALWQEDRFHVWLIDSRAPIDPNTGLFPEMADEGDDALLHFVSKEGTALEAAGWTAISPMHLDWKQLAIGRDPSGGFRALFYDQSPAGREQQGVAVLRSKDGGAWERASAEQTALSVYEFDGIVGGMAVSPGDRGLFAWVAVRTRQGSEAIRVAFRKEKR